MIDFTGAKQNDNNQPKQKNIKRNSKSKRHNPERIIPGIIGGRLTMNKPIKEDCAVNAIYHRYFFPKQRSLLLGSKLAGLFIPLFTSMNNVGLILLPANTFRGLE